MIKYRKGGVKPMSLTVREVMQKLSKEHPDSPCKRTIERLFYDENNILKTKETEIDEVPVESVTREIDGSVVIG
jgi:hypothetical protein